jgi:hypothetical protein
MTAPKASKSHHDRRLRESVAAWGEDVFADDTAVTLIGTSCWSWSSKTLDVERNGAIV